MERTSSSDRSRKSHRIGSGSEDLVREVTQLLELDAVVLKQKWAALFGAEPSPNLGRPLMISVIAYRLQERALGGLKPSTQRLLGRVSDGTASAGLKRGSKHRASAGTVLIREWHGVNHRVTVLDNDVVYRGRRWAFSLERPLTPKNIGPDQWVPVITRATSESDL